ncbi:hypothetical protein [Dinoroseobacter sp. S375]|uniref:hypothetical protein n=1 Tax=Dinoroseobacter sp. S375 TaxID=3415136 RepID=UPI003C7D2CC8
MPFPAPILTRATLVALLPLSAAAQDAEPDTWRYQISPYLWGASLEGDAGVIPGLPPAEVDLSFSDILDDLEVAAMVVGQARRGDWALQLDLQHVRTRSEGAVGGAGVVAAKVDATIQSATAQLDYLAYEGHGAELWVTGGLRYWNVETTLTLGAGDPGQVRARGSDSWWDPVVGLRGRMPLGASSYVTGWAYLGGFGTGSDFMTDLFLGAGYDITETVALVGGIRYQSVDRTNRDFIWDVEQAGPVVGLTARF